MYISANVRVFVNFLEFEFINANARWWTSSVEMKSFCLKNIINTLSSSPVLSYLPPIQMCCTIFTSWIQMFARMTAAWQTVGACNMSYRYNPCPFKGSLLWTQNLSWFSIFWFQTQLLFIGWNCKPSCWLSFAVSALLPRTITLSLV